MTYKSDGESHESSPPYMKRLFGMNCSLATASVVQLATWSAGF
jgi:hypothetical protein